MATIPIHLFNSTSDTPQQRPSQTADLHSMTDHSIYSPQSLGHPLNDADYEGDPPVDIQQNISKELLHFEFPTKACLEFSDDCLRQSEVSPSTYYWAYTHPPSGHMENDRSYNDQASLPDDEQLSVCRLPSPSRRPSTSSSPNMLVRPGACAAANPSTFLQPKSYFQPDSENTIYAKINSKDKHAPPKYFKYDTFEMYDESEESDFSDYADSAFSELSSGSEFKELDLKELHELEQEKRRIDAAITIQRIWRGISSRKINGLGSLSTIYGMCMGSQNRRIRQLENQVRTLHLDNQRFRKLQDQVIQDGEYIQKLKAEMDAWSFVTCQKMEKLADSEAEKSNRIADLEEHFYSMSLQYEKQAEDDALRMKMMEEKLTEAFRQIESLKENKQRTSSKPAVVPRQTATRTPAPNNRVSNERTSQTAFSARSSRRSTTTPSRRTDTSSSTISASQHNIDPLGRASPTPTRRFTRTPLRQNSQRSDRDDLPPRPSNVPR